MLRFFAVSLSLLGLVSCGDITPSARVSSDGMQTAEGQYIAGVGDAVLEVVQQESLPNAFGGADIFGRTRPTGTVGLYYAGRSGNEAVFVRRDVAIQKRADDDEQLTHRDKSQLDDELLGYVWGLRLQRNFVDSRSPDLSSPKYSTGPNHRRKGNACNSSSGLWQKWPRHCR